MQSWEGHHVDSKLTQISVELSREAETGGDSAHDTGHQVVEISVGRGGELEGAEADIIQGLVIDTEGFIGVFHELMNR